MMATLQKRRSSEKNNQEFKNNNYKWPSGIPARPFII